MSRLHSCLQVIKQIVFTIALLFLFYNGYAQSSDAEKRFGKGSTKEQTTNSEKNRNSTVDHHTTIYRDGNGKTREFIDTTYDNYKNGTEISDIYFKQYDPSGNLTSQNSFVYAAGANVNLDISNSFGVGINAEYGRSKLFDRNQNNLLFSIGATKKFGNSK